MLEIGIPTMAMPWRNRGLPPVRPTTPLFILLDAIRSAEKAAPEATGLAELFWRYSQGVELNRDDLAALDLIIARLRTRRPQ